jgi:cation transport ATPase
VRAVVLTNVAWAFFYNALAVPFAVGLIPAARIPPSFAGALGGGGWLTAAGLSEVFSSVPVVLLPLVLLKRQVFNFRPPCGRRRGNAYAMMSADAL